MEEQRTTTFIELSKLLTTLEIFRKQPRQRESHINIVQLIVYQKYGRLTQKESEKAYQPQC